MIYEQILRTRTLGLQMRLQAAIRDIFSEERRPTSI